MSKQTDTTQPLSPNQPKPPRPTTAMDVPLFNLIPDTHPRQYANVNNRLEFAWSGGKVTMHDVVIPTSLFSLMKDTLKIDPSESVSLYIVQEGDFYIFGIAYSGGTGADYCDLWLYNEASLPPMFV